MKQLELKINQLSFGYRGQQVLREVSFSVRSGELMCLLGPNGVGKSTLFRCILGGNSGYQGEILLDGRNIRSLKQRQLAQWIGYIPQSSVPVFGYSVYETVLMGTTASLGTLQNPGRIQRQAAQEAIDRMGIAHLSGRSVAELSGGERQLVMIARALAQKARFLLMDEPTANLDYGNQLRVMQMVRELARQGYGTLISTHSPEHALQYADRVLVLKEGQVLCCGEPEQVLDAPTLSRTYDVPLRVHQVQTGRRSYRFVLPDENAQLNKYDYPYQREEEQR